MSWEARTPQWCAGDQFSAYSACSAARARTLSPGGWPAGVQRQRRRRLRGCGRAASPGLPRCTCRPPSDPCLAPAHDRGPNSKPQTLDRCGPCSKPTSSGMPNTTPPGCARCVAPRPHSRRPRGRPPELRSAGALSLAVARRRFELTGSCEFRLRVHSDLINPSVPRPSSLPAARRLISSLHVLPRHPAFHFLRPLVFCQFLSTSRSLRQPIVCQPARSSHQPAH
jgi:hypothetical protein